MALTPDNYQQYQNIPERNLFGLKPPPPTAAVDKPPPQVPKIILTGITTILGNKRALMKTQPAPAKPGEQAKENSFILTEGQREGDIEVLQIDENAGSVKVNNSGTEMTLTFEKDGAKLPVTPPPPPAAAPGMPVVAGTPIPAANTVSNLAATNNTALRPLPTRNFRLPASARKTVPAPALGNTPSVPAMEVPTPTGVSQPQTMTPEEAAVLQQIQRETAVPAAVPTPAPNGIPATPPVLPQ